MKVARALPPNPSQADISYFLENASRAMMGNLSFGTDNSNSGLDQNVSRYVANGTTPSTANLEFQVGAAAGYNFFTDGHVPWFFFHLTNNGGVIYKSASTWNAFTIYLKCTTTSAVFTLIII